MSKANTKTQNKDERPGLVETFVQSAEERLTELQPLVEEARELEKALASLNGNSAEGVTPPASEPKPRASKGTGKRSRKGGTREEHFIKLVKEQPGITVSDAAKALKIQPNYLYRVAKKAMESGEVKQDEKKGYIPAEA